LSSLTDHSTLCISLPWAVHRTSADCASADERIVYRWVDGTSLSDYSTSWVAWSEHTAKPAFGAAFNEVLSSNPTDVDALSLAVENFLLNEAIGVGVVVKQTIKAAANPNRKYKSLAPWFDEECRAAKHAYKLSVK
jgi:hypothetical protein